MEGSDRKQVTLLPECLDDYITEDNPMRVVDAFVEELNLEALGFPRATPAVTGRPAYHPGVLLKIYIYGYLNRVASSRRCEDAGITAYVPKPMTSNSKAAGRFSKADFIYIRRDDEYQCPAGERLRWRQTTLEKGINVHAYGTNA